jgi:hypothetical protein
MSATHEVKMCRSLIVIRRYICGCYLEEQSYLIEDKKCGGCGIAKAIATTTVTERQPCSACIKSNKYTYALGTWKKTR